MTDPDARLLAHLDGELPPAAEAELERDLAAQPELRERLDEVRRFHAKLRAGLPAAPAYDLAARPKLTSTLAFAANAARVQRRWRAVRFAAAACLLVGVGSLVVLPVVGGAPRTVTMHEPAMSTVALPQLVGDYRDTSVSLAKEGRNRDVAGRTLASGGFPGPDLDIPEPDSTESRLRRVENGVTVKMEQEGKHSAGRPSAAKVWGGNRLTQGAAEQAAAKDKGRDTDTFGAPPRGNELLQSAQVAPVTENLVDIPLAEVEADDVAAAPDGTATARRFSPIGGGGEKRDDGGGRMEESKNPSGPQQRQTANKQGEGPAGSEEVGFDIFAGAEVPPGNKSNAPAPTPPGLEWAYATGTDGGATYAPLQTNPWVLAERDARSTFALDTDRASSALARRHLDAGVLPPPDTVRVEEFVNAFDYHDRAPENATFALRAEAAPAPFCRGATLLRLGVKGRIAGRDGRRPAHLVLVVDASGSMDRPDRGALARRALTAALSALAPEDRVTVVAFAEDARLLVEGAPAGDPALARALDTIPAQGASNLAAGLALGYAQAQRGFRPGAVNRVVLVSDGIATLGETGLDPLVAAAEAARRQGIATTTVGVGAGSYDDALLARLAKRGDGHYLRLDADAESQAAFVADLGAGLQTIAADAKLQVVFDPARVRRWRQLGYEQRALAHADFTNDAVDAGEIGSGQAATALYELELVDDAALDLGSVHMRYRDPVDGAVRDLSWRLSADLVRPRPVAEAPAFHLAAAAAEFAELLRRSEHAADGSYPAVADLLERVSAVWPHDDEVRDLLRLVRTAPGLPPAR